MRYSIPPALVAVAIAATAAGTVAVLQDTSSAAPAQTTSVQQNSPGVTPAPHILPFAGHLQNSPKKLPGSAAPVPQSPGEDGCDHDYGTAAQCVPWNFPPGVGNSPQERCAWLDAHGLKSLPIHGNDRQQLDRKHDGIACEPGS